LACSAGDWSMGPPMGSGVGMLDTIPCGDAIGTGGSGCGDLVAVGVEPLLCGSNVGGGRLCGESGDRAAGVLGSGLRPG
jgi:hypothetical protein